MDAHGDDHIWEGLEDIISLPSLDEDGHLATQNPVPIDEIDNRIAPQLDEYGHLPIQNPVQIDEIDNQMAPELDEDGHLPVQNPVPIDEFANQMAPELDEDGHLPSQNPVPIDEIANQMAPQLLPADNDNAPQQLDVLELPAANDNAPQQLDVLELPAANDNAPQQLDVLELPAMGTTEHQEEDVAEIKTGYVDLRSLPQSYNTAVDFSKLPPMDSPEAQNEILTAVIQFFSDFKKYSMPTRSKSYNTRKSTELSRKYATFITSDSWIPFVHSLALHLATKPPTATRP